MTSHLHEKKPLVISDRDGVKRMLPVPELLHNFRFLHYFLEEVYSDWKRASQPYQVDIDQSAPEMDFNYSTGKAFLELQPIFLKTVFSYVMFFIAAASAYEQLYSQLNEANHLTRAHVKHHKPPRENRTIRNIQRARNWSIVHMNSSKADELTSVSAISWQPLSWGKRSTEKWDVDKLQFGTFRRVLRSPDGEILKESKDIELPGISKLHETSMAYLEKYNAICSDYLDSLHIHVSESTGAP